MAGVQFAQLSTVRLYGVCGPLHQCLCQAVPARQCLPALLQCSLRTAVCSCHIISGGDCIFCHIPVHAQQYICRRWVWMTKWDAYLDLTVSVCISVYAHTRELGQENLFPLSCCSSQNPYTQSHLCRLFYEPLIETSASLPALLSEESIHRKKWKKPLA